MPPKLPKIRSEPVGRFVIDNGFDPFMAGTYPAFLSGMDSLHVPHRFPPAAALCTGTLQLLFSVIKPAIH
ncbi:hypothetical protein [Sporolactobacillus pectinivorans]|uniref:hypothetical protein n=1 Tax=Sporolactobacillus pectinivorans TaxID=1591408 RepID=UPI000C25D52D|nr:hypothetical protein [Sporolactobacillus pectinivorans]